MVAAGSVAEVFGEIRKHFVENARVNGSGGMVVEINGKGEIRIAGLSFGWRKGCAHVINRSLEFYRTKLPGTPGAKAPTTEAELMQR